MGKWSDVEKGKWSKVKKGINSLVAEEDIVEPTSGRPLSAVLGKPVRNKKKK